MDCPGKRVEQHAKKVFQNRSYQSSGIDSALLSVPFIINAFVAAEIAQGILPNWRWGYGMFAILVRIIVRKPMSYTNLIRFLLRPDLLL